MKKKIICFILLLLTISWMCVIYGFSCETAADSSQSSGGFIKTTASFFSRYFESLSEDEQNLIIEKYDHFVRKAAHFTIYTILGGLLYTTIFTWTCIRKKSYIFAFAIGALYAVSDEIHQYFVPGRACMIRDMLLDSLGVAFGSLLAVWLLSIIHIIHDKLKK